MKSFFFTSRDPVLNLATEEAFLNDYGSGSEPLLLFYINDPCFVIGRNQNPWAEVAFGVRAPIYRRCSGGGAVYHDAGNLNWAFVGARECHNKERELGLIVAGLQSVGVAAFVTERGTLLVDSSKTPGASADADVGKSSNVAPPGGGACFKVGGTARRFYAHAVLHHGTLLVSCDLGSAALAGRGLSSIVTKAVASVQSPMVNLGSLVPNLTPHKLARVLSRCVAGAEPKLLDADAADVSVTRLMLMHASWDWRFGRTSNFLLACPKATMPCTIFVEAGLVARVTPAQSGLPVECSLFGSLPGQRFDYSLFSGCECARCHGYSVT